jgi:hypothetical protein
MRGSTVCLTSLAVILAAGCGKVERRLEYLQARSDEQASRLIRLEKNQEKLDAELDALRQAKAAPLAVEVEKLLTNRVAEFVASEVKAEFKEQVGSRQEIEEMLRTVAREQAGSVQNRDRGNRGGPARQDWAQRRTQWEEQQWQSMAKDLNLTDTQTEQMKAANQTLRKAIQDKVAEARDQGFNADKLREIGEQLKAQHETQVSGILNAEQMEAYRKRPNTVLRMLDFSLQAARLLQQPAAAPGPAPNP